MNPNTQKYILYGVIAVGVILIIVAIRNSTFGFGTAADHAKKACESVAGKCWFNNTCIDCRGQIGIGGKATPTTVGTTINTPTIVINPNGVSGNNY